MKRRSADKMDFMKLWPITEANIFKLNKREEGRAYSYDVFKFRPDAHARHVATESAWTIPDFPAVCTCLSIQQRHDNASFKL